MHVVNRAILANTLAMALFCGLMAFGGVAVAQTPINVSSDTMTYAPEGNKVIFEGNVHVTREGFQIWAARIEIVFAPKEDQAASSDVGDFDPGNVQKIVASGSVRLAKDGRTGTCGAATYFVPQGMLQMEGSPVLQDGQNSLRGKVIRFYMKDNRSEVVGGEDERVNAIFYAPEQ